MSTKDKVQVTKYKNYKFARASVIILISFFLSSTGYSQNKTSCPNLLYYEAIDLFKKMDTLAAQEKLIELYSSVNFGNLNDIYNLYASGSIKSFELNKLINIAAIQKGIDVEFYNSLLKSNNFDTICTNSTLYVENNSIYLSRLDSFLIKEVILMRDRDQSIRTNYKNKEGRFEKMKYLDSTNMLLLKSLIKYNQEKLPSRNQLGSDGYAALVTILHHFDIENFNDVLPYVITAINTNNFFNAETILYQVDRNTSQSEKLYLYNPKFKKFDIQSGNIMLHDRVGYYQYYGGVDMFDSNSKKRFFWPSNPNRDMNVVSSFLSDLCMPLTNPLKSNIEIIDAESFIQMVLKYR